MKTVLTLDVGTSSARGTLFSIRGERLCSASHAYAPDYYNDGRVRQSPSSFSTAVLDVLTRCSGYNEKQGSSLLGISLTSQRASVIPVDREGRALCDTVMWQDKTSHRECDEIKVRAGGKEVYAVTGLRIDPYFSAPRIMWLRNNEPDLFAAAATFMGVQDYVAFTLTGRRVSDHTQGCRTLLMDVGNLCWSRRMLEVCSIEEDRLPELLPPGSVAGTILPEIAGATGIPAGTPLFLAGGDQQVAAVGMGVLDPGSVEANTGTGSFMITPVQKPLFHPEERTLCSVSAVPGQWVAEAGVLTTGILYSWFSREFVADEGFSAINALVSESPPGANGILALPHFKGSAAPFWNPYAKGLFFNITLANTRADMARAVLESIVLEMGANLNLLRSILPDEVREVVAAGGLTKFEHFNQLQADVFGTPVKVPAASEASTSGALICALVGLGIHGSHAEAFRAVAAAESAEFLPDPGRSALYSRASDLRERLYAALDEHDLYSAAHEYSQMLEG
jgi:sugar (pentulose or hexulose) kinase